MIQSLVRALVMLSVTAAGFPGSTLAQCEFWVRGPLWDSSVPNGAEGGSVKEVLAWDPDGNGPLLERLVIAGSFVSVQGVPAIRIAQYDPLTNQWMPFGPRTGYPIEAMTVFESQIVIGCDGDVDPSDGEALVQRWDGSAWIDLPLIHSGRINDIVEYRGDLYVVGRFLSYDTAPGTGPAMNVARWDRSLDVWVPVEAGGLGTDPLRTVNAAAVFNNELYLAGERCCSNLFETESPIAVLFRFDGLTWTEMHTVEEPGSVYDLAVYGGELILGGWFEGIMAGVATNVAAWTGIDTHGFGAGIGDPFGPGNNKVRALGVYGGLVAGGFFAQADGQTASSIARWPAGGSAWESLGSGITGTVHGLCLYRNELIAVGDFASAGGRPAQNMARWNGSTWQPFGGGSANDVRAFASYRGRLVAGGSFMQPTESLQAANNIAGWRGGALLGFGSGMNGTVRALESFKYLGATGDYELIAGGTFTLAGGVTALSIARWREDPFDAFPPPSWEPMGAGFNASIFAIERGGGVTYAAGDFNHSGTTPISRIARWNETTDTWESMGSGLNGTVRALKYFNGQLYAGGVFTTAGGVSSGGLARWNGTSWSNVGGYFVGAVHALEVHDGYLYIGGSFQGLPNGSNIARYDGTYYSNVGFGGADGSVEALHSVGSRLYVGGAFTTIGGVASRAAAFWDGAQWSALDQGLSDGAVWAIGSWSGEAQLGGTFTKASLTNLSLPRWARWTETGTGYFARHPTPTTLTVGFGYPAVFTTEYSSGSYGKSFQWYRDGQPLIDGTNVLGSRSEILTILHASGPDQGSYHVEATTDCGVVVSNSASLALDTQTSAPSGTATSEFSFVAPNPTARHTTLAFSLDRGARVEYVVFDVRGRRVVGVSLGTLPAGRHQTIWSGRDGDGDEVASGIYRVRMYADGEVVGDRSVVMLR